MNCENYQILIERYMMKTISEREIDELEQHISECEHCRKEYKAIIGFNILSNHIKDSEIQFHNRAQIIQLTFNKLEVPYGIQKKSLQFLMSYKFRVALSSVAAGLLLFFAVQQVYFLSSLQELEKKSINTVQTNYSKVFVKTSLMSKYMNSTYLNNKYYKLNRLNLIKFLYHEKIREKDVIDIYPLKQVLNSKFSKP